MSFISKVGNFVGWTVLVSIASFLFTIVILLVLVYRNMSEDFMAGVSKDAKTSNAVGVVELEGEIKTAEQFRKDLKKLVDQEDIKAIVVRIDSPGGGAGASEEIYQYIKTASIKKPIVCSMAGLAASGGLYASMGCKKIFANKGTITGSIGVIFVVPKVYSLLDKFGVGAEVIKSGKFKDTGSPLREMTPEERAYLQTSIDQTYEQFVGVIAASRSLKVEDVKKYADGRIILGEEAKKLKLIDECGGLDEAAKAALKEAGITGEPELIFAKKKSGIWTALEDASNATSMLLHGGSSPKLQFLMSY